MGVADRREFCLGLGAFAAALDLRGVTQRVRGDDATLKVAHSAATGLRVYTCGHSWHFWVAPILRDIAEEAGIENHQIAGVAYRGGSTVLKIWDTPPGEQVRRALASGQVDVLTLAPIWLPDPGIEKFAQLGLKYNPNIRITVQESWLPDDAYHPVYPLEVHKYVDHDATKIPQLRKETDQFCHDLDSYVRDLNRNFGKQVIFAVPVGDATVSLREKIVEGKAPSLKVQWRLFRDYWGHPTPPLEVLTAYCTFAVIYRRNPIGLPMPPELLQNQEFAIPALNRLLQTLAWDAVVREPLSGVSAG